FFFFLFFFFFQAEDGIRDLTVTGVQTCALPIYDDVRNIFALTSALETYNMEVLRAENGREGIETLEENPDIDIVLMDIMMPEMRSEERRVGKECRARWSADH